MKKNKLIIILIAVVCVVSGCVIMGVGFALSGFDLRALSTMEYVDKTYDVTADFSKMDIRTLEEDVVFAVSADGKCKIEARIGSKTDVNISVSGGMLTVRTTDNRKWYERISIAWDAEPVLRVYLPKTQYDSLYADTSSGDIYVPADFEIYTANLKASSGDITCTAKVKESLYTKVSSGDVYLSDTIVYGMVEVRASSGDVTLKNILADDISISLSSGETELRDVVAENTLEIVSSSGDIDFERCDGAVVSLKTSSGDIEGSLLTDKEFYVKTSSGDVRVPQSVQGAGECKAIASSGDIEITIK